MWSPEELELIDEYEFRNITTTPITYVEEDTGSGGDSGGPSDIEIFTVTVALPNQFKYNHIGPVGNQIIGYFDDVFEPTIRFVLEDQSQQLQFTKFSSTDNLDGHIFFYQPDPRDTIQEPVIATATGDKGTILTREYYITVRNDRDLGRLQLIEYVSREVSG